MSPPWSKWADKEATSKLKNSRRVKKKKKKKQPTNQTKNFLGKGGAGNVLFTKLKFYCFARAVV